MCLKWFVPLGLTRFGLRHGNCIGTAHIIMTRIVVVQLSPVFDDLWDDLARGVGVSVERLGGVDAVPRAAVVVAVIVAAGGLERDALDWVSQLDHPDGVPLVVIGSEPSRRTAIQAMARGATDYLVIPEDVELLNNTVVAAIERRTGSERSKAHTVGRDAFADVVGESDVMRAVLERAARTLPHAVATTLIVGETGTGKELLARALHDGGPRRGSPFVPVNCAALPANLIESELFGHERGAFTDAHAPKAGLFEIADGGTLFLDEVGTLPLELQAKLLRVLDDHHVRRVGGTKSRLVDIRITAATNDDLRAAVRVGTFREDLFYRLNVVTHVLPPLRDRENDVVIIADHLIGRVAHRYDLPVPRLTPRVRSTLLGHHWPGNIRELKNAIERAMLLSPPGELREDELVAVDSAPAATTDHLPFPASLAAIMTAAAAATLDRCGGNRSEAARQLSISRRRLARLLGEDP